MLQPGAVPSACGRPYGGQCATHVTGLLGELSSGGGVFWVLSSRDRLSSHAWCLHVEAVERAVVSWDAVAACRPWNARLKLPAEWRVRRRLRLGT